MTDPRNSLVPTLREYVVDIGERAGKTFVQTLAGVYVAANVTSVAHFAWLPAVDFAAAAAVLSVLTSLGSPLTGSTTASLLRSLVPLSSHRAQLEQAADQGWQEAIDRYGPPPAAPVQQQTAPVDRPRPVDVLPPVPVGPGAGRPAADPESLPQKWADELDEFVERIRHRDDTQEVPRVLAHSYIRRPRAATQSLTAEQVAAAYNYPGYTGKGVTVGIVELGGAVSASDMKALGYPAPTIVDVDGGKPVSDGPNGADGEVMLDVEVVAALAPDAKVRVYFGPNTDAGFLAAITRAAAECDVVSISWGGPEDSWDPKTIDAFDQAFAAAKAAGVNVFCAAGDAGSGDGESGRHVDFPASSPHVIGCGGTRLTVNADGTRAAEVVWNDSSSSAGGGGVSVHFPGRDVPDVAGNADPVTGYEIRIDGGGYVIGGTSAVAPLYAALCARLIEAHGSRFDFMALVLAHPEICFDVTSGSNGAFRAGPGRDEATGFGVVDGSKALAALAPAPPAPGPTPQPPTADGVSVPTALASQVDALMARILKRKGSAHEDVAVAKAWESAGV